MAMYFLIKETFLECTPTSKRQEERDLMRSHAFDLIKYTHNFIFCCSWPLQLINTPWDPYTDKATVGNRFLALARYYD